MKPASPASVGFLSAAMILCASCASAAAAPPARYEGKTAVEWAKLLLHREDLSVLFDATDALEVLDPQGKIAVPILVDGALHGKNRGARLDAAEALKWLAGGASAEPALLRALDDGNADVRDGAVLALGDLQCESRAIVPALMKVAAKDKEWRVRGEALFALTRRGSRADAAVPLAIAALKDKQPEIRSLAARALGNIQTRPRTAIPALAAALDDEVDEVRYETIKALGNYGASAAPAVKQLAAALRDKYELNRLEAAEALQKLGSEAGEAVPALAEALKYPEKTRHAYNFAEALAQIGPKAAPAIPVLITSLESKESLIVSFSADALRNIGSAAAPSLAKALVSDQWRVREEAARILGRIGPAAHAAGPALRKALKDDQKRVRHEAAVALWQMERSPEGVSALIEMARDERDPTLAILNLGRIGSAARAAAPTLIERLKQPKQPEGIRRTIIRTLRQLGPDAKKAAAPLLVAALDDNDCWESRSALTGAVYSARVEAAYTLCSWQKQDVVVAAMIRVLKRDRLPLDGDECIEVLASLGPAAKEAIPALVNEVTRDDARRYSAAAAIYALADIGWEAKEAVPVLVKLLKKHVDRRAKAGQKWPASDALEDRVEAEQSVVIRGTILRELDRIGPPAKIAVPLLLQMTKAEDRAFRLLAAKALWSIAKHESALPLLLGSLGDRNWQTRGAAARFLGQIGPPAREAAPRLKTMMKSKSDPDREAAATALWQIERDPASIPVLIESIPHVETVRLLGTIGPPARAAVPALLQQLRAKDPERRCNAALSLWRIAGHEAAVPILLEGWTYNPNWSWHDPDSPMRQLEADPKLRAALEKRSRQASQRGHSSD